MSKTAKRRGRPRKPNAKTAAERMRACRKRKKVAGLKQVRQWVPAIKSARGYSDHCLLDARSLALHCKIAQKISQDPTLINQAKANLERWAQRYPNAQPKYFSQWKNILNRSWEDVAAFITSLSEEATQLRQSSPFAGILTTKERKKIYDAF